jgi:ubiquinone/menaquinone biosynthesis C-methylase UbiE
VGQRVDFSPNASVYDRRHGAVLPRDVAQELADGVLEPGAHLLDVGAGTGRVTIVFADVGYPVTALDPAVGMLNELRVKARVCSRHRGGVVTGFRPSLARTRRTY